MRFDEFTLRVPGDEFRLRFHERLTVLAGVGPVERQALVESLIGSLTGTSDATTLRSVDHTGRPVEMTGQGGRVQARHLDDGTPAPAPVGWFAPDGSALRELVVVDADTVGLSRSGARTDVDDPPELAEARETLRVLALDLDRARRARDHVELSKAELADLEEQIRSAETNAARREYAVTLAELERVRSEAAALQSGDEGATADRSLIEAAGEAAPLVARWTQLRDAGERARAESVDEDDVPLPPDAVERHLRVPESAPANLPDLLSAHTAAVREAAALDQRLRNAAAENLPEPSDPAVIGLAAAKQDDLWKAHDRLVAARQHLSDERLALGGIGQDVEPDERTVAVDSLEDAHARWVLADDEVQRRRVPIIATSALTAVAALPLADTSSLASLGLLAVSIGVAVGGLARPWLARARAAHAEAAALESVGAPTYLSFHLRRVDATLDPSRRDRLELATAELELAERQWRNVAGDVDIAVAGKLREDVTRYAESMHSRDGMAEELSEVRRRLDDEALPALGVATEKLLAAVTPYGLVFDDLTEGPELVAGMVRTAVEVGARARAQRWAEEAERDAEKAALRLEEVLERAGFSDGPLDHRIDALEAAAARARDREVAREAARPREQVEADLNRLSAEVRRLRRPEWAVVTPEEGELPDLDELEARRDEVLAELAADEEAMRDLDRVIDRHAALERRVAALEAQLPSGARGPVDVAEVHQYLFAHLTRAANAGPREEPVPVLCDDPFGRVPADRKWELMDLLLRLSAKTQLVYLTDDPFIGAWARRHAATGAITLLEPVDEGGSPTP